jgi:hypothetical protein
MKKLIYKVMPKPAKRNTGSWVTHRRPMAVSSLALGILALTFFGAPMTQQQVPAGPVPEDVDYGIALQSFTNAVAINSARQMNPELMKQDALVAFSLLHPSLVPTKVDEVAAFAILNPWAVEAELQKDPAFLKQQEAAFAAMNRMPSP